MTEDNKIKEEVLKKIQEGDVKMKPKSVFVIKAGILVLVSFFVFVFCVMLVSYLIFSLGLGGHLYLITFGKRGLLSFIMVLPWYLLVFSALSLIILDYLIRRFRFGYHSPVIYLFIGTLFTVTLLGTFVNFTSLHRELMKIARNRPIPLFGNLYGEMQRSRIDLGVFRGQILSTSSGYIVIKHNDSDFDEDFGELRVRIPDGQDITIFSLGDRVIIAGDLIGTSTEIRAYGLHKVYDNN